MDYPAPLVVAPGDGSVIEAGGVAHLFRLTGEQTAGSISVEEFHLEGGELGARPHVHRSHDEIFCVLDGELTFHTGSAEVVVAAGGIVAATRGRAHGFRNAGTTPARALCLYTPGGYENFFRDVHAAVAGGAEFSPELMAEVRARYDSFTLPLDAG